MVDPIAEALDERDVVHTLIAEVARVVVEPERGPTIHGFECALRRGDVEGNLRRVHLEREADACRVERVEDRIPAIREVTETGVDHCRRYGWEAVEQVPDRGAGEP